MLIDLYLSGYNNTAVSAADIATVPLETDDGYNTKLAADGLFMTSIIFYAKNCDNQDSS